MENPKIDEVVQLIIEEYRYKNLKSFYIWGNNVKEKTFAILKVSEILGEDIYFKKIGTYWNDYDKQKIIVIENVQQLYEKTVVNSNYLDEIINYTDKTGDILVNFNSRFKLFINFANVIVVVTSTDPPETMVKKLVCHPIFELYEIERIYKNFHIICMNENYN